MLLLLIAPSFLGRPLFLFSYLYLVSFLISYYTFLLSLIFVSCLPLTLEGPRFLVIRSLSLILGI